MRDRHRLGTGSKTEPRPWQTILAGLVALAAGSMVALRGLGIITAGQIYAPPWVLVVAGLVFILPGLFYLYFGAREAIAPAHAASQAGQFQYAGAGLVLGALVITLFAVLATAAAVYSWFPEYAAGFSSSLPGSIGSRLGWALAALVLDAIVLSLWGYVLVNLARHYLAGPE
jgi:hypothetical protein